MHIAYNQYDYGTNTDYSTHFNIPWPPMATHQPPQSSAHLPAPPSNATPHSNAHTMATHQPTQAISAIDKKSAPIYQSL